MPGNNYGQLVLTGADYIIMIDVPNALGAFNHKQILTAQEMEYDIAVEDESVHAISTILPIAEKSNAKTFKGTLILEAGELNALLQEVGLNDASQLQGCTLAITAIVGAFARVFTGVNFNGEKLGIKAKDKHTPITLPWKGLGVNLA